MIESTATTPRRRPTLFLGRLFGDLVLQATAIVVVILALISLGALLYDVFADGWGRLNWQFLTSLPSRRPAEAGIYPALIGTMYLITLTTVLALPIGIAAAIYLEEYGKGNWLARIIEINIANLAGVPSIIYGLLGLGLFVRTLGFGRSVMAGAATMALLVLPIVILVHPRSASHRSQIAAGGVVRTGRDEMADDLASGPAQRHAQSLYGGDPGALPRDWRDRTADHDWRPHLRAVRAGQHLVAVHGAADSDFRLALAAAGRILPERSRRHHRAARAVAHHERRRNIPPRSLSAAPQLSTF